MKISRNGVREHLPFIIFFILFLVVGISTYKDYGISWDEPISRDNNGVLNYNFMRTGDYKPVITGNEKYHGPAFEIFLVWIEHVCGIKEMQGVYFMRHLVTFLAFALSVFFFYLLCFRYLKSKWLATLGAIFLVLSPRIFADSFYNSKDLTFMSFVIINLYTTLKFLEKKNFTSTFFHALVTAIVIDIRILGIVFPCFTFLFLLFDFLKEKEQRKKIILFTLLYCCLLTGVIILLWPVLWRHPIDNFILAIKEMSKYPWDGYILYLGEQVPAKQIPWHYIPVWILISTPIVYIFLFFTGIIFLIKKIISRFQISKFEWLNLYIFFFPLLAIIILHSIVYDGWRHMYFTYPSFLIFSLIGLEKIIAFLKDKKSILAYIVSGLILYELFIVFQMFRLHPYEHVYFNFLAGKSLNEAKKKFEVDYWGLSYRAGLDHILKTNSSQNINICSSEITPAFFNSMMFHEIDRARFSYTDETELADYYLSAYRFHHEEFKYEPDFKIVRDGGNVFSLFDIRNKVRPILSDKYRVAQYIKTNENIPEGWSPGKIIYDSAAFSGQYVESADSLEYVSSFSSSPPPELLSDSTAKNYIEFKFRIKTELLYDLQVVLQIDSGNGKMYEWRSKTIQSKLQNTWTSRSYKTLLPKIYSPTNKIKIYLWNRKYNKFVLDDMEINFYSVPGKEAQQIFETLP